MGELTPLTKTAKRRKFSVLDVESKDGDTQDPGFTRPFMVGTYSAEEGYKAYRDEPTSRERATGERHAWDERYWKLGGCVDRAMRGIIRGQPKGGHVYAHNAGRFDYLFLLPWLANVGTKLGLRFQIVPVGSSIQVLDVWREGSPWVKWRFLDSFKLIPTSLDKAAKSFGLAGKLAHDLAMHEEDPRWEEYNAVDCEQLYLVLDKFHSYIENVLLGEVGITAPSTAMKVFRRNHLRAPVARAEETHEFVRRGYFGGRVEVFERQAARLRYYDINSSYPAAMLEDMPAGEASAWEGEPPERFVREKLGFVECDVVVPDEMHVPPLPVKQEGPGKLIFPTGRLRGVWEWEELSMALQEGCRVERWGQSYWYPRVKLFESYVRELYKYRDKSRADYDAGLAEIAKILLNSLYGKFGMRTMRKKVYCWDDPKLPESAVPANGDPECVVWIAEEESDAPYVMPQVSARTTALGRVRLYRGLKQASCSHCWPRRCSCSRREFVAYTDTDSILTPTTLPTSAALGDLKDELPEHSGKLLGRFLGPKVYVLTSEDNPEFFWEGDYFEKVKAKGLEDRSRRTVDLLAQGGRVYQERLEKCGTLIRAGMTRGPKMRAVPRRILKGGSEKRVRDSESYGTTPHRVEMW